MLEMNNKLEEAISRLKIIHDYKKQVYDMEEMKPVIVFELPNEDRKAIETALRALEDYREDYNHRCQLAIDRKKQLDNCISKDKIRDRQMQRQFELQQEYKDFEDDAILIVLQKLLEGRKENEI